MLFRHSCHRLAGFQWQQPRGSGPGWHGPWQWEREQKQLQGRDGGCQHLSSACHGRIRGWKTAQHRSSPGAGGWSQQPNLWPAGGAVGGRRRRRRQGWWWQRWKRPLVGSTLRVSRINTVLDHLNKFKGKCEFVLQVGERIPAELSIHRQLTCIMPPSSRKDAFLLLAHGQSMQPTLLLNLYLYSTTRQPHNLLRFSPSLVPTSLLRMHAPTALKTNWSLCLRRAQEMACITSLCLCGLTTEQGRSSNPLCCCWRACEDLFFYPYTLGIVAQPRSDSHRSHYALSITVDWQQASKSWWNRVAKVVPPWRKSVGEMPSPWPCQ